MSAQKIIWAVVILVLLGGGYWYWSSHNGSMSGTYGGAAMSTSSPSDASDTALDQDTAAVDAQLNAAASDSATANSSINDTPVAQ